MKTIHYILYVAFAALLFTACQEEDFGSGAKGGIRISLTEEVGVDVSTRSTPEELGKPMASQFKFKITDNTGATENYDYTDKVIPLSAGTYDVVAYCGDIATTVALDAPYYEGAAEATVEDGKTTNVKLSCKVANALLSIRINEDDKEKFEAAFETPSFQLTVGGKSVATSDITKSFYFPAGSTISKLAFSKDGSDYQELEGITWPSSIKAADHIIVTVGIEPAPSGVSLTVEKMKVETVTIKETIPMEWLPKPKVEAEGFDGNALTFAETETPNAKLNLELASALQDIKFKFDFQDEQFSSLTKDEEYLLSTDKATIEQALGISLPAIGATNASIDFAGLVAKLQSKVDGATTNKIMIVPKANDRWSSEKTDVDSVYTFTCNKPQFSIAVQPGNVWTKTFAIDEPTVTAGNADVLKEKLVYQYKEKDADDNAWQTCSGGLEQVFSKAPTNKEYQVRAFYREGIASNVVDVELESPAQLPNSGFEDWYEEDQSDHKNLWFPYAHEASGPQWTTNNLETTHSSSDAWDSPSAVKRTTVKNSGNYAVWIRTVGHGNTNTNAGVTPGVEWAITGTHTKGVLSYSNVFTSRPTQVSFYYRYIQKGDDAGVVELKIENQEQNIVLFETSFTVTNTNYIKRDIPITYSVNNVCATHMTLTFISGSKHEEVVSAKARKNNVDGTEANEHYGSEFYVDDIQLIYDK